MSIVKWRSCRTVIGLMYAIGMMGWAALAYAAKHETVSVRLAWIPGVTFVGDYVAQEKGFWSEQGLEVSLEPGGFEFDAIRLVAGGANTFGVTSGPQILNARANGVPVVAIGAIIPQSPIGWVSKKDSGIKGPKEFPGKRIGSEFGTHTEITLEALCSRVGVDVKSFERIAVKFDPRPFLIGQIDVLPVYIIDQPMDLEYQGIALNIIDPGDYGVALAYGNLYFTTEEMLKKHPDRVREFLAGARRGWLWAYENRDEAIEIIARKVPDAKRQILRSKLDAMFAFIMKKEKAYDGIFGIKADALENTYRLLREFGGLKRNVRIGEAFNNTYLP